MHYAFSSDYQCRLRMCIAYKVILEVENAFSSWLQARATAHAFYSMYPPLHTMLRKYSWLVLRGLGGRNNHTVTSEAIFQKHSDTNRIQAWRSKSTFQTRMFLSVIFLSLSRIESSCCRPAPSPQTMARNPCHVVKVRELYMDSTHPTWVTGIL